MHTIGMAEPIHVIFLDETFVVLETRIVDPARVCVEPGATWVLEMDRRREPPPVGARIRPAGL